MRRASSGGSTPRPARVILLDAGERVVAAFSPRLSKKVADELGRPRRDRPRGRARHGDRRARRDVRGRRRERADRRTDRHLGGRRALGAADRLRSPAPPARSTDRGGRIKVNPDLTIPGHPEISVIGRRAPASTGPTASRFPGLATVAIQQAHHVAKGIRAGEVGASTPFKYLDKGALAVVGRGKAVCEIRGLRSSRAGRRSSPTSVSTSSTSAARRAGASRC